MSMTALTKHRSFHTLNQNIGSVHESKDAFTYFATAKLPEQFVWNPGRDLPGELVGEQIISASRESSAYQFYITPGISGNLATEVITQNYFEPVFLPERTSVAQPRFIPLQKWEGTVIEVSGDTFFAHLVDQSNVGPDEEAEFSLEEVTPEDKDLLEPGAVFYWNIGYLVGVSGQRTRCSDIRFRRLPVWRADELEQAKLEAKKLGEDIGWK